MIDPPDDKNDGKDKSNSNSISGLEKTKLKGGSHNSRRGKVVKDGKRQVNPILKIEQWFPVDDQVKELFWWYQRESIKAQKINQQSALQSANTKQEEKSVANNDEMNQCNLKEFLSKSNQEINSEVKKPVPINNNSNAGILRKLTEGGINQDFFMQKYFDKEPEEQELLAVIESLKTFEEEEKKRAETNKEEQKCRAETNNEEVPLEHSSLGNQLCHK
jgi:hypothetical protein